MSQIRDDESPNGSEEKKQIFFHSCKVSELLSSLANVENEHQKHQLLLKGTQVSLFHTLRSVIKSSKTAVFNKQSTLPPEPTTVLQNWSKDAVAKTDADSQRTMKSKNSCVSMSVKCLSKLKTTNSAIEGNKNADSSGPLPVHMLPYVVLIKNCLPLSISSIHSKCCKAEILSRILYITLRLWKKKAIKPLPRDHPNSKLQTPEESKYVNFFNLKDLQWKFYKGIVKRKQKVRVLWREADYRPFKLCQEKIRNEEYILPLIPKNWIIHESLK
ncbi:uncharacterized protein LOC106732871 [Pelodiscus sinensis]|uniref:uncharacterized protein LOC106732871 n=1 Tax=Pelodiscus sinensis TaxID=13735 RepID=UPI000D71F942|nr:uncharacterized protein LOC106732871 [Pelodiscus sinensis]XP_025033642.1 uncharacterized protein LOC106732871 [Pelodiscus sinensis]XP_025033643.1 uncharacterized protein LOC106732871 [Pelodiscus sinensis]XP_025033644.1 uncharacterized protein LOC106732871 [Pelodiscus sinensis]|eukprot:XP_025033641.1 uncharacterized protein LOC106732871 [Pelodiscus sinensis]